MAKLKEVCAYVRVSTNKQEELSPDSQIRMIKEYATAHNMLLTKVYIEDHGISGRNAQKRPAFQEMIATCKLKEHPYDAILLWKFSRFARNIDESTYYKAILRKKCNVDVISISEPIIEGMYGRLIEMVIEWSDEFYLYNLSGEVMRGMTQNAMRGGYNANAPIGYTKKKGELPTVDPDEARIVQKIFHMYANENRSKSDIASLLNQQGIRTRRGSRWETRTIGYVLENPFYIGKIRWNFYDRGTRRRKKSDDVILVEGQHEAIISEELWYAAADRIAHSHEKYGLGTPKSVASTKHWLSGMIKCSACGGSLSYHCPDNKSSSPANFHCWKRGKGVCPTGGYINCKTAEQEVIHILKELAESTVQYEYITSPQETDDNTSLIRKELEALTIKDKRIRDAYINGVDSLEEYKNNKELLSKQRNALMRDLRRKEAPLQVPRHTKVDIPGILEKIQNPDVDYITKGNALRDIFDRFIYDKTTKSFTAVLRTDIQSTV